MRKIIHFKLLLSVIFLVACGQTFAQSVVQNKKATDSEVRFEKVYKILVEEPKWLFEGFASCPLHVFPAAETKLKYNTETCAENAETCLNSCKNNDGNACYSLALLIQDKKGLDQKYAEVLFLRACKLGVVSGCTNRAAKIFDLEDEKSVKCAAQTFEMTCKKNDPWGCTMFGLALHIGVGVAKDSEKALEFLTKACKGNEEHESCEAAKKLIEQIKESQPKK